MIQALRDDYDITVMTWVPVDLDEINRYFGTELRPDDFRWIPMSRVTGRLLEAMPIPLHHLKRALLARAAFRVSRDYDVIITANNETDLGVRAIQYVHFPARFLPRPKVDIRWYHRFPGTLFAYHAFVNWLSDATVEGIRRNRTLTNSEWTGRIYRQTFGATADTQVLYPPVLGRTSSLDWSDRSDDFVCIGRISPEKRVHRIVAILEAVRNGGWNGTLHLVGHPDSRRYWRRIRALIAPKPWIRVHFDVSRDELHDLVARSRYGIHGMTDEHFGISIAEMTTAGCVVFVPNGGGQLEIVDSDPRIVYDSHEDAIAKIRRVLGDQALQRQLSAALRERASRFSAEAFMEKTRQIVREFDEDDDR